MSASAGRTPTPVVLVHGIRTSRTMWRAQQEALEAAGHMTAPVDLPGHGARIAEPFDVASALATIDDAVEEVGGRALVVGLSLGGYLSIAYTAAHPEKVRGLIAAGCCTAPSTPLRGAWLRIARRIDASGDGGERLNAFMVRRLLPAQGAADVAAGGFALHVMTPALEEVGRLTPLEDLARLQCPLWLVNGQLDHFRLQERAYLRAAHASGQAVRHVVIRGARHLASLDRPVAFTRVVLEALESLDGAGAGRRTR